MNEVIKLRQQNPFPFSDDNKRYHTWNYYLQHRFGHKCYKVPLNAGFTCPNRDGFKAVGGCTFCSALGSGEFAGKADEDLLVQYQNGCTMMERKWPYAKTIPYFQSFTNTYGPLKKIKACIQPFLNREEVVAIAIATRADCITDECIAYLNECAQIKEIWIELGLQSIHDKTAERIHRGHTYAQFLACIERLSHTRIHICVHLINALPYETREDMLMSAFQIAQLPIHAVKLHMLHIMQHTQMAMMYQKQPFPLLSQAQYVDIVIEQLERFPAHIVIQRLTGDGKKEELLAPIWTMNKKQVLNDIDKEMQKRNTWQGRQFK